MSRESTAVLHPEPAAETGAEPFPEKEARLLAQVRRLELRVRKASEADFTKDTEKYGIEVFKDENTGNLVYISESGSIAVVPAK